jgi:hypothetical protein
MSLKVDWRVARDAGETIVRAGLLDSDKDSSVSEAMPDEIMPAEKREKYIDDKEKKKLARSVCCHWDGS